MNTPRHHLERARRLRRLVLATCPVWFVLSLMTAEAAQGSPGDPTPSESAAAPYSSFGTLDARTPEPGARLIGEPAVPPYPPLAEATLAPAGSQPPGRPETFGELSLEHRRYLLYLNARLSRPRVAERLAATILKENPSDKQTLLVLASMYLERKETQRAMEVARSLVRFYPQDPQALYFLASAAYQAGQFQEASRIFSNLKLKQFKHRLYPYASDLASSALRSGEWYRGMLAYQDLLAGSAISPKLRTEARHVLEGIYYEHLPALTLQNTSVLLRDGFIDRANVEYRQHVTETLRFLVRLGHEDIKIEGPGLQPQWMNWEEGWLGVEGNFNRVWRGNLWLGASQRGALGGVSLTRRFAEQRDITLTFAGAQAVSEGVLFEALDGREHRLELSTRYLIDPDWLVSSKLYGRELVVGDHRLGLGAGGSVNLERILVHDHPELRAGYRGVYARFHEESQTTSILDRAVVGSLDNLHRLEILDGLVLPELHRHGLYWTLQGNPTGRFGYHCGAGLDYAVELHRWVYDGAAGVNFYPIKSLQLGAEAAYTSSARTSDLDSDQWQVNIALKYWF